MKTNLNKGKQLLTGAALTVLLMTAVPMTAFADDDAASYGYLAGQQQSASRQIQFETIEGFATDAQREAYYETQGIGGGAYSAEAHLDAQALAEAGVISRETADQISQYAGTKHDTIHARFEQMSGMTEEQRHTAFRGLTDDGFPGDSVDALVSGGILTQEQADAIDAYLSGISG